MSALRPLKLVDGPTSPGPLSAPYSSLVSPPPSASTSKPDRRLSLQLQSPRTPATPTSPSPAQLKRHSTQSQSSERRVLTLAERHADLLRFIAQKESKCLELRQQLAQHEADLLALKRKWERIVSRGTAAGASTSSMPTPTSSRDSMDFLSLSGGIKDGMGRMLSGLALGDMFPSQSPDASDNGATQGQPAPANTKADAWRASLSGSSASTTLSEVDQEDEDGQQAQDSIVTTPSEELLVDLASPVNDDNKTPPLPASERKVARPSRMTVAIGHAQSPSLTSPPPIPLHSTALANIVPMVNRKWEELKGTETLQKSQKRASMLLNDVFAALVPPAQTPTPTRRASGNSSSALPLPSPALSTSSGGSHTTTTTSALRPRPNLSTTKSRSSSSSTTSPAPKPAASATLKDYLDDDDWNW